MNVDDLNDLPYEPPTTRRTLWKNVTVLSMDSTVGDLIGDVLVEGSSIAEVGPGLSDEGAQIVDGSGFAMLPGFIDTHRHTWQSVLRGLTVGDSLGQYQQKVQRRFGALYQPADVYAGTALGALGALESGVTTVCDEAHIQNSPAHTDAGIEAWADSGMRAVFDYGWPSLESEAWMVDSERTHPEYVRDVQRDVFGGGREAGLLNLQLMLRGPVMTPRHIWQSDFELARELDLRVAMHTGSGAIAALHEDGLLDESVTLIHCADSDLDELALIPASGASVSVAANLELNMPGLGSPPIGRLMRLGLRPSLSVDVETTVGTDMFSVMRAALISQAAEEVYGGEQSSDDSRFDSSDVLAMATIEGARAAGLGHLIGSITPGKQADFMLINLNAANLAPATDPARVIVSAGHAGNVDAVVVAGSVRKWRGEMTNRTQVAKTIALAAASRDDLVRRAEGA